MSSNLKDRQVFIFNTDWEYYKNVAQGEGCPVVQYVRDETGKLIKEWKAGDMALVWINQKNKVAAFYTIKTIAVREDQLATIEEFDESSYRPHRVSTKSDPSTSITLDLRRKSYAVYYQNSNKRVPMEVLSAPITQPIPVRVRWALWKYEVSGEDIHPVTNGFEIKHDSEVWYKKVDGPEREHILEQIDTVVWGGRVKPKKRVFDEIESKQKQQQLQKSPSKPKPLAKIKAPPVTATTTPYTFVRRLLLGEGSYVAIRADEPKDGFMIAQVTEQTDIDNLGTAEADNTEIPIRWLVEGRESSLRGSYCFPNWLSSVRYGAVIKTGIRMLYSPDTDMYIIDEDYDALLAMC